MRIACKYRIKFDWHGDKREEWMKGWILAFVFSPSDDGVVAVVETTEQVLTEVMLNDITLSDQKGES